jgi:putative FmdB family regulatory protein
VPTYEYKCTSCQGVTEITHSIKESPEVLCEHCECKTPMERLISWNPGGFIMKQWTEAMAWKTKRDKMKGRAEMGVKQIDRYGMGPSIQPNVAGMEVDTWSDAQKVAKEAGLNTASYEPHIEKEQAGSKIKDTAWKTAKIEAGKI